MTDDMLEPDELESHVMDGIKATDSLRACMSRSPVLWNELKQSPSRFRVLTGDRTTGRLHIGHYFGSLASRLTLQSWGVETFLVLADYQAITDRNATSGIKDSVMNIMLDYLAIGIDPAKCTIFCHSLVPSLNQLMLPFLSVVSLAELRRNPTVKEEISYTGGRSVSGLMMTYPVHQAADILFCHGNVVPGGKDQLPHIEVARVIARRINNLYFGGETYFPEPELLLSNAPLLLGLDGRKMGKSLNNSIYIGMSEDETAAQIKIAKTDSIREIAYDAETRPEVANLLKICSLCSGEPPETIAAAIGSKGSSELKRRVTESVNEFFRPIRKRRQQWETRMDEVQLTLKEGTGRANEIAAKTLNRLQEAMNMKYF